MQLQVVVLTVQVLAAVAAVVVLLAVLLAAVVLDLLDLLVAVTAADTKKPYRQKNTPNFFRGILGVKS